MKNTKLVNFFYLIKIFIILGILLYPLYLFSQKKELGNKEKNSYLKRKFYLSLAGSGNPWGAVNRENKYILLALHEGFSIEKIAAIYNLSVKDIKTQIKLLVNVSLLKQNNNTYTPTFFISDLKETNEIYLEAKKTGKVLVKAILSQWDKIKKTYSSLSLSTDYSFQNQAFLLVGSRILDLGLLGAMVRDGTFLSTAPLRPSPKRPQARYYFWGIEGDLKHLGKYGQSDWRLPKENWYFETFGNSYIKGKYNQFRENQENKIKKVLKDNKIKNPEEIARLIKVPLLNERDSKLWAKLVEEVSKSLVSELKTQESTIKELFSSQKAGQYAHNSYREFMCWYIHLSYSWAIDILCDMDYLRLPGEHFSAIVLYKEGLEGLLL